MVRIEEALVRCGLFVPVGALGSVYLAGSFVAAAGGRARTVGLNGEPSEGGALFDGTRAGVRGRASARHRHVMRRLPLALFVAALAAPLHAAAQGEGRAMPRGVLRPGIGTEDPRRPVDVRADPWHALGRVQLEVGGRCTGVLVGPRTVLTAAHCLFGPRSRQVVRPGTVHFLLGYHLGEWTGRARVTDFIMGEGFRLDRDSPLGGPIGADWALLTLDTPLGDGKRTLRLRREPPQPGTALMLAGYQQDRPEALLADTGCRALGLRRGAQGLPLLSHGCAGTRGASGAPLLARGPDGAWEVAGVASAAANGSASGVAVPAASLP